MNNLCSGECACACVSVSKAEAMADAASISTQISASRGVRERAPVVEAFQQWVTSGSCGAVFANAALSSSSFFLFRFTHSLLSLSSLLLYH